MKKIKLYTAISLDGKVAKPNGDVKWLEEVPNPEKLDYGYTEFYASIDTTIMGNNSYKKILSFGIDFPYPDTTNYVFTRNKGLVDTNDVQFKSGDVLEFVRTLKKENGKDIWLIGGGQINSLLFNAKLVDELWLFVMPVVLGEGIPLFENKIMEQQLILKESFTYPTGVVFLKYCYTD